MNTKVHKIESSSLARLRAVVHTIQDSQAETLDEDRMVRRLFRTGRWLCRAVHADKEGARPLGTAPLFDDNN
ncbi:hypothetical protein [Variovorax arabinosiphilus]|uniref:hypothetical protein n=1 Tax=Variovorax arabinosiphilus TaxID=3053498 RepID=UPI002576352D|nr:MULTISPECIES: hypothetical protein [unclassified Variovorax]MDM0118565.1 hypothetical protein [Variovorax sp. J2L1-78]MDM0128990.1 hypothetical protein [Variovorax sp. J2L1-63]MDM0233223.1 hypothetical protein [Variovorax sp. J2R1-6]